VALFKALPPHLPGETEESNEKLIQVSWSSGRDLILGPSEYDAEMLSTRPRHSVLVCYDGGGCVSGNSE
jgi:hypothetical protein